MKNSIAILHFDKRLLNSIKNLVTGTKSLLRDFWKTKELQLRIILNQTIVKIAYPDVEYDFTFIEDNE